jgi:hypothetical protein
MTETPVIWVSALVTLTVLSYAIRDNPAYRLVQHATLGVAVGIMAVILWVQVLYPRWALPMWQGWQAWRAGAPGDTWRQALWILALVPGALWYFQLSRRWFWLSTLISGLFVGAAAGLAIKYQTLLIFPQISASMRPIDPLAADGALTWGSVLTAANNVLFLVVLLTALLYFFFSIRTDHAVLRGPLRFGRLAIMACLGTMFGATVLTRIAYLLERLTFLSHDWFQGQVLSLFRAAGGT